MPSAASDRLIRTALALGASARSAAIGGGVPYGDSDRDRRVRELPEFPDFSEALRSSARVHALYGAESPRLALAWAYAVAREGAVDALWQAFWASLIEPNWQYVSVANLTNFRGELSDFDLDDSVRIHPRRAADIGTLLGWSQPTLDQTLGDDWLRAGSPSEHVITAVSQVPKKQENVVLASPGTGEQQLASALMAMRLAGAGDVGLGSVFTSRIDEPAVLLLGLSSSASDLTLRYGETYEMDGARHQTVRALLSRLKQFEPQRDKYVEVASALDRFRAAYGRPLGAVADRVVDDVIALEAVAVVSDELSYRIAIRVSGLLADADADRVSLFRLVRAFYNVRSTIVHGGRLKPTAQALLQRERELRDIVRMTIRALMNLTDTEATKPTHLFLRETIDDYILDAGRRVGLRVATGIPGWQPAEANPPAPVESWTTRQWL